MKNKRLYGLMTMLVILSLGMSGCAELRDKFIRKPKKEKAAPLKYQPVRQYDVHPSMKLYTKRYIFWKEWNRELLDVLMNSNNKKKTVAAEQALSNLVDMQNMLVDEKAAGLQKYIDEMSNISNCLKTERLTGGNAVRIRRRIETLGRQVKLHFSYTKIRGCIRADFRSKLSD